MVDSLVEEIGHHCEQSLFSSRRGCFWSEIESHVWHSVTSRFCNNRLSATYIM
jgi:hypothetical protein